MGERPKNAISMTDHAARRYRERLRPGLSLKEARQELRRIVVNRQAELTKRAPGWATTQGHAFLSLGDDAFVMLKRKRRVNPRKGLPPRSLQIVTVITRRGG